MKLRALTAVVLAGAVILCAAGTVITAGWIARFGLFAPRAPVSAAGTAFRLAFAIVAANLVFVRRDPFERITLVCCAVAACSTALCGLGLPVPSVLAIRLIFHLLAYALGAIALIRIWLKLQGKSRPHEQV